MNQIYFAAAIRGERIALDACKLIINELEKYGNVLTKHIINDDVHRFEKEWKIKHPDINVCQRDHIWLNQATHFVAEITGESTGVGYEISYCYGGRKLPSLCFYSTSKTYICRNVDKEIRHKTKQLNGKPINIVCYEDLEKLENILPRKIANFFEHPGNYKLK